MTTIGQSVIIQGEITSDEDLTIEGRVRGQVNLPREATWRRDASHGRGRSPRCRMAARLGNVKGTITATQRIELAASAVVEGSLSANLVVIADGATFHGQVDMDTHDCGKGGSVQGQSGSRRQ